ncbi:MAG TPA: riboflavin synthase [Actinomycetes bacterium]|nr:riboflavin synthase [Actinomycetes bacterium]
MFTGIVEELGRVLDVEKSPTSARIQISGPLVTSDANVGDSIAVNGVCLTVTSVSDGAFSADVMHETLKRSSLGGIDIGSPVNLERPVTLATRLGGHLVQGHVDATSSILTRTPGDSWETVRFGLPEELARYVVEKGSITVDGVSLTVSGLGSDWFEVSLIPTTLELTTLGTKQPGDLVNLEVDVVAKYVERMLQGGES